MERGKQLKMTDTTISERMLRPTTEILQMVRTFLTSNRVHETVFASIIHSLLVLRKMALEAEGYTEESTSASHRNSHQYELIFHLSENF